MQWYFHNPSLLQMIQYAQHPIPWDADHLERLLLELWQRTLRKKNYPWKHKARQHFICEYLNLIRTLTRQRHDTVLQHVLIDLQQIRFKNASVRYLTSYALQQALKNASPLYIWIHQLPVLSCQPTIYSVSGHFGFYFDFYDTRLTPLQCAAECGYTSACEYFLAHGVPGLEYSDGPYKGALHLAASIDHLPTFSLLWQHALAKKEFDPYVFLSTPFEPLFAKSVDTPTQHTNKYRKHIKRQNPLEDFWTHLLKNAAKHCFDFLSDFCPNPIDIVCSRMEPQIVTRLGAYLNRKITSPTSVHHPNAHDNHIQGAKSFLQMWVSNPLTTHPYDPQIQHYKPPHPFLSLLLIASEHLYQHYFFHNKQIPKLLEQPTFLRFLIFYSALATAQEHNNSLHFFAQHLSIHHWEQLLELHEEQSLLIDLNNGSSNPTPLLLLGFGMSKKSERINALLEPLLHTKIAQCALEAQLLEPSKLSQDAHIPGTSSSSSTSSKRASIRL